MQRLQNAQIDDVHIPYYRQETVPTFLGFGSFHGESWLSTSEKDCLKKNFVKKTLSYLTTVLWKTKRMEQ